MIKGMHFLLCILISVSLQSWASAPHRNAVYVQDRNLYAHFHGKYDVVMFGDSLTERGHWQDMFPDVRIGNRGIGGDDTDGMLQRLNAVKATGAKTVFIMAGTNDLTRHVSPEKIASNIIAIARELSSDGIKPVIQSTILSGKARIAKNPYTLHVNELLKAKALENGFIFIDLNKFIAPDGYLPDDYTTDGTHLTLKGYIAWERALSTFIQ